MAKAYYNEFDPFAAQWLRNLIEDGKIAQGDVDERSIKDVSPDDVRGYTQCHWFAGIGGWSLALRLAGWDDSRPCWTGSCPCTPFSTAGKRKGKADDRHLWPEWFRIIRECRPPVIFGEQVPGAIQFGWIDHRTSKDLRKMQGKQDLLRVLQKLQGELPKALQELYEASGEVEKIEDSACGEIGGVQGLSKRKAGTHLVQSGKASSEADGQELFADTERCFLDSERNRQGSLPGNRTGIQPGRREDVGQPIVGQDRFDDRIHAREHQSGSLLRERDGKPMGREQDCRNIPRNDENKTSEIPKLSGTSHSQSQEDDTSQRIYGIRDDLDREGYTFGFAVLPTCSLNAPHLRQRLYWVAIIGRTSNALGNSRQSRLAGWDSEPRNNGSQSSSAKRTSSDALSLGNATSDDQSRNGCGTSLNGWSGTTGRSGDGDLVGMDDATSQRDIDRNEAKQRGNRTEDGVSWATSSWSDFQILDCKDGKKRRSERGVLPLVDGIPKDLGYLESRLLRMGLDPKDSVKSARRNRTGRLKGYGNAICAQVAAIFIRAFLESEK